jgi:hypothetical protein
VFVGGMVRFIAYGQETDAINIKFRHFSFLSAPKIFFLCLNDSAYMLQ